MSINHLDFPELQKEHPEFAQAIISLMAQLHRSHMVAFEAGLCYGLAIEGAPMHEVQAALDTYRENQQAHEETSREIMDCVSQMLTPDLHRFRATFEQAVLARYGLSSQVVEV